MTGKIKKIQGFFDRIRIPEKEISFRKKIINTAMVLCFGLALGYLAKLLDCTPSNELPYILQLLDLGNFLSRMAIWVFLAAVISFYSITPVRAAIHSLLFFSGMLFSYYAYTKIIAGFFPVRYILIWVTLAGISPLAAFICWYAKGKGMIAVVIASMIAGVLFMGAFSWGSFYFDIRYPLEALIWLVGMVLLYRSPKQIAGVLALSIIFGMIFKALLPFGF